MKKILLIVLTFFVGSVAVNAQRFVKPGGSDSADGRTWETAWATLEYAVNHVYSDEPIYFAAGNYTMSSGAVTSEAINSTVQQRTNYIIIGGFPANLTGTDTNPYDPANNITQFGGTAILNFRENTGNLDLQGIHFDNVQGGGGAISGPIFTANDTDGKTYKFTDLYVHNSGGADIGEQGLFKFENVDNSTIIFRNSVFEDNTMHPVYTNIVSTGNDITIEKCYFKNNSTFTEGGALKFRGANNITISNSTFCENTSPRVGGAVMVEGQHELTLNDNKFINNESTTSNGGALYVNNTRMRSSNNVFIGNRSAAVASNNGGGALCIAGSYTDNVDADYIFDGDFFQGNQCNGFGTGGNGGAILAINLGTDHINLEIKNSEFYNNYAYYRGGAVLSQATVEIENCKFQENSSAALAGGWGGAVCSEAPTYIKGSCFYKNTVAERGGALAIIDPNAGATWGTERHIVEDCVFYENSQTYSLSTFGGGAIATAIRDNTAIVDCEFYNNSAYPNGTTQTGGGAIHVYGLGIVANDNVTRFSGNKFAGNLYRDQADASNNDCWVCGGGSDIKTEFAEVQGITNSVMQLAAQSDYPTSDYSFSSGNTFGGVSPIPANTCTITPSTETCAAVDLTDWFRTPRAVDDIYRVPQGQTININNIFDNDYGEDGTLGVNLANGTETFTSGTPSDANITIDSQGNIVVGPNTPLGTHTIEYTICGTTDTPPFCSTATVYITVYPDYDGDGVEDSQDLDNDNDGILDATEGKCGTKLAATSWTISADGKTATHTFASGHTVEMTTTSTNSFTTANFTNEDFWSDNTNVKNQQGVFNDYSLDSTLTITFKDADGNPVKVTNPVLHIDKIGGETGTDQNSAKLELRAVDDFIWERLEGTRDFFVARKLLADAGAGSPKGDGSNSTPNWQSDTSTEEDLSGNAAGSAQIVGISNTFVINISNFELATTDNIGIIISACFDTDTDKDGTPDYLDLDSDGDKCADAIEGGDDIALSSLVTAGGSVTDGQSPAVVTKNLCGTYADTQANACVYSNGVPKLVNVTTGQTAGLSQDASTRAASCACEKAGGTGDPRVTKVGVSTLNRNVENWLNDNAKNQLGAYLVTESTQKGFVITRNEDPATNIASAKEGMMVWDTTDKCLKLYNGTEWQCISKGCNE